MENMMPRLGGSPSEACRLQALKPFEVGDSRYTIEAEVASAGDVLTATPCSVKEDYEAERDAYERSLQAAAAAEPPTEKQALRAALHDLEAKRERHKGRWRWTVGLGAGTAVLIGGVFPGGIAVMATAAGPVAAGSGAALAAFFMGETAALGALLGAAQTTGRAVQIAPRGRCKLKGVVSDAILRGIVERMGVEWSDARPLLRGALDSLGMAALPQNARRQDYAQWVIQRAPSAEELRSELESMARVSDREAQLHASSASNARELQNGEEARTHEVLAQRAADKAAVVRELASGAELLREALHGVLLDLERHEVKEVLRQKHAAGDRVVDDYGVSLQFAPGRPTVVEEG